MRIYICINIYKYIRICMYKHIYIYTYFLILSEGFYRGLFWLQRVLPAVPLRSMCSQCCMLLCLVAWIMPSADARGSSQKKSLQLAQVASTFVKACAGVAFVPGAAFPRLALHFLVQLHAYKCVRVCECMLCTLRSPPIAQSIASISTASFNL